MKIRGSLAITKDLELINPNGTLPFNGAYLHSEADGKVYYGNLVVNEVESKIYPRTGSLVLSSGQAYISILPNANGSLPLDLTSWEMFGGGDTGPCDDCVSTYQIGPYPPGTPLEDIIYGLHFPNSTRNLDVSGYGATVPENTTITNPTITWEVDGAPANMRLSDDKGIISNVDVTGLTSYTPTNAVYQYGAGGSVTWTLTNDDSVPITTSIIWEAAVVFGITYYNTTGATTGTPTEATILAGIQAQQSTDPTADAFVGMAVNGENFFVAIPESQNHTFLYWLQYDDPLGTVYNVGADGSFQALEDKGTVQVNGEPYHVYATAYATALAGTGGLQLFN